MNTYETTFGNDSAANALPAERARFIRKTYLHLAAAILALQGAAQADSTRTSGTTTAAR